MKKIVIIATVALVISTSAYLLTRKSTKIKSEPTSTPEVLGENIVPSPTATIKLTPTETPETPVKGYGQINEDGTNTTFVMDIPISGGKVTGTISGYCVGNLSGVFDPRTDFIQGTMKGSCFKIPAAGMFEGKVNLKSKMGSGTYEGKSATLTRSGPWNLVIKP